MSEQAGFEKQIVDGMRKAMADAGIPGDSVQKQLVEAAKSTLKNPAVGLPLKSFEVDLPNNVRANISVTVTFDRE